MTSKTPAKKPPRRVGAEDSKTRLRLLNCVERLMVDNGYAGVSYRAVAAKAGVTAGLVQYYFPTLDDLFVAAIRRRSTQNVERLTQMLHDHQGTPLRALWDYSLDESTAALTTEFMALGNHRPSIRAEIADVTEHVRRIQLDAIQGVDPGRLFDAGQLSPSALLFLITGIPKLIRLEKGVGVASAHNDVIEGFQRYLDSTEPATDPPTRKRPASASKPRRNRIVS